VRAGDGVEERGFADVWEAYDSGFQHRCGGSMTHGVMPARQKLSAGRVGGN
jgi:hypothetical protein